MTARIPVSIDLTWAAIETLDHLAKAQGVGVRQYIADHLERSTANYRIKHKPRYVTDTDNRTRGKRVTADEITRIRELAAQGKSGAAIAAELNVHYTTARRYMKPTPEPIGADA